MQSCRFPSNYSTTHAPTGWLCPARLRDNDGKHSIQWPNLDPRVRFPPLSLSLPATSPTLCSCHSWPSSQSPSHAMPRTHTRIRHLDAWSWHGAPIVYKILLLLFFFWKMLKWPLTWSPFDRFMNRSRRGKDESGSWEVLQSTIETRVHRSWMTIDDATVPALLVFSERSEPHFFWDLQRCP